MKKTSSGKKHIWLWVLVVLFFTMAFLLPLLRPGFIVTDDGDWMIIRLTAFYQALSDGQFPVRYLGRLNNSYGYPVANFLYPGYLYIGSLLHLWGASFLMSIKIITAFSIIVSSVCIFLWLRFFSSSISSFVGTMAYLFSPYLTYDLYKRGSVGELLATGITACIFFSIEAGYKILMPILFGFLLISHNTLALFYSICIFFYICVRKKWNMIFPIVIGIVMASFFWIPALSERAYVVFQGVTVSKPANFFIDSQALVFQSLPFLLVLIAAFFINRKQNNAVKIYFIAISIVVLLLTTTISSTVWNTGILEKLVQFPYRFLSLWFISIPWLTSFILEGMKKRYQNILLAVTLCIVIFVVKDRLIEVKSYVRDEGYYMTNEATTTVADEFMPKWVTKKREGRSYEKLELFSGNSTWKTNFVSTKRIDATIVAEEESVITVNTIYYPGWGGVMDNKPIDILYNNPYGLIQLSIPKGSHRLELEFRETAFRFVADSISLFGLCMYLFYIGITVFHFKFQKNKAIFFQDLYS